jgi:hypothetical protein
MRVNSMTVTLRDPEGQERRLTVDIPEEPRRSRSVAVEKIAKARRMLMAGTPTREEYQGVFGTSEFSHFYLASIDRVLREAMEAL